MLIFFLLSLLVLVGHTGWWLFCYNRVNASALPRRLIKSLELLFLFFIVAIPAFIVGTQWQALQAVAAGNQSPILSPLTLIWIGASLISLVVLGPMWLESRVWLWPPKNLLHVQDNRIRVGQHVSQPLTGTWLAKVSEQLPLNEITCLNISRKTIQLERTEAQRGLTIGHVSDVHFTGQLTPAFYHFVMDQFQALQPDLIVLSGDIVDEEPYIAWLEPILGRLQAPLGRFFVLGNHERRLKRPEVVAEQLAGLGWNDLGVRDYTISSASGQQPTLVLYGNERPWFERHQGACWQASAIESTVAPEELLRIGVAHTPDQQVWARDLGLDLLLAGHTHGGQIRVPGIGPIIAPSRYGSRFASGVFRLPPTVMHVSRGLAGVHPWRWRCMPEISLLTIQPR